MTRSNANVLLAAFGMIVLVIAAEYVLSLRTLDCDGKSERESSVDALNDAMYRRALAEHGLRPMQYASGDEVAIDASFGVWRITRVPHAYLHTAYRVRGCWSCGAPPSPIPIEPMTPDDPMGGLRRVEPGDFSQLPAPAKYRGDIEIEYPAVQIDFEYAESDDCVAPA